MNINNKKKKKKEQHIIDKNKLSRPVTDRSVFLKLENFVCTFEKKKRKTTSVETKS